MKCQQCGGANAERQKGNHLYSESGLPNVTLVGVTLVSCPDCGARGVMIPKIEKLHAALAEMLITTVPKLSGPEVRFLRKYLGLSGVDFAERMGVAAATVSRWENDKEPIGGVAERLLRLMVAHEKRVASYVLDDTARIAARKAPKRLEARLSESGWEAHAA